MSCLNPCVFWIDWDLLLQIQPPTIEKHLVNHKSSNLRACGFGRVVSIDHPPNRFISDPLVIDRKWKCLDHVSLCIHQLAARTYASVCVCLFFFLSTNEYANKSQVSGCTRSNELTTTQMTKTAIGRTNWDFIAHSLTMGIRRICLFKHEFLFSWE